MDTTSAENNPRAEETKDSIGACVALAQQVAASYWNFHPTTKNCKVYGYGSGRIQSVGTIGGEDTCVPYSTFKP